MLSLKGAAHADYYKKSNDLLSDHSFAKGKWFGSASARLKIESGTEVDLDLLAQFLTRFSPTLPGKLKPEKCASDFLLSAPKSVSLLWALGSQETSARIEASHNRAITETVNLLMANCIYERKGKGGKILDRARAVAAVFTHTNTRPAKHADGSVFPDPSLHSHVVVPDTIWTKDDNQKVAYTAVYGRWSMGLGAWYRAWLSYLLKKDGYPIEAIGDGLFQIAGFPIEWMTAFSARREEAKQEATAKRGDEARIQSSDQRATKQKDSVHTGIELFRAWSTFAASKGIDVAEFEGRKPPPSAKEPNLQSLCSKVIRKLAEKTSVFQLSDIYEVLGNSLVQDMIQPSTELIERIKRSDKVKEVAPTAHYDFPQWSTKKTIEREKNILELAEKFSGLKYPAVVLPEMCREGLTARQWEVAQIAASAQRLVVIEGPAGTGKTALLKPVIETYQRMMPDIKIIGAATAWHTAEALKNAFDLEAYAIAKLMALVRAETPDKPPVLHLTSDVILIIDEVGLLSSKDMENILKLADTTGLKLILLGDEDQLEPISAGSGLRLIKKVIASAGLSEVLRQKEPVQKAAAQALIDQNFELFVNSILDKDRYHTFAKSRDGISYIIDQLKNYYINPDGEKIPPVALVRSNWEIHDISRKMRALMKTAGVLGEAEATVEAATPMGRTVTLHLAIGDHIRFLVRHEGHDVVNGTRAVITAIECEDPSQPALFWAKLRDPQDGTSGREISFKLDDFRKKDDPRVWIAPAYASTVFSVQGLTLKNCIVLLTPKMTYRELYVAVTRAEEVSEVVEIGAIPPPNKRGTTSRMLIAMRRRRIATIESLHRRKKTQPLAIDFCKEQKAESNHYALETS